MLTEQWIYSADNRQLNFADLDLGLQMQQSARSRLKMVQKLLVVNKNRNRFYIGQE